MENQATLLIMYPNYIGKLSNISDTSKAKHAYLISVLPQNLGICLQALGECYESVNSYYINFGWPHIAVNCLRLGLSKLLS